jgi:hypothetical protein
MLISDRTALLSPETTSRFARLMLSRRVPLKLIWPFWLSRIRFDKRPYNE